MAVAGAYPGGRDFLYGRCAHIDQRYVVAVERLVVIGVDGRALAGIGMVDVGELVRRHRVFDDLKDLVADKLSRRVVGLLVEHDVAKCSPKFDPALAPGRLVDGLAFLWRRLQGKALRVGEGVSRRRRVRGAPDLGRVFLDIALELGRPRCIACRNAVGRAALKNAQVLRRLCDHRRCLNAGRSGTNQPDPLSGKVDALVRPLAGVVPLALERVQSGNRRNVGRRQAADGGDQELCVE